MFTFKWGSKKQGKELQRKKASLVGQTEQSWSRCLAVVMMTISRCFCLRERNGSLIRSWFMMMRLLYKK